MCIFGDLCPPLGLMGFCSVFVVCCLSLYLFKKISAEVNVPVRDSTRNHSWTSIKVTSKVSKCNIIPLMLFETNYRLGTAPFVSPFCYMG